MNYEQARLQLSALNIDLPEGTYSQSDLMKIIFLAESLPKYTELIHIPNGYENPRNALSSPPDPRFLNYDFRKMILKVKKIGGLSVYSHKLLSVKKISIVLDLDWTMIYAFRTSMAYSETQVEVELRRLKTQHPLYKLEKKYIPSSQMYLIIAIRPGLIDFLSKLMKIAVLYIYTSAEEEYARIVIGLIDTTKRLFENRIIASSSRVSDSHKEKDLRLARIEDISNVLIIDDQIDVWKAEYRDYVIPSMRFAPLYNADHEVKSNPAFADKIFTYVYEKSVRSYRDESLPFMDDKGKQFECLYGIVNDVYVERFACMYAESAAEIYQRSCKKTLEGKVCSLSQITGPEREVKVSTFTAILTRLGAKVDEEGCNLVLVDSMHSTNNPNARNVLWLLMKYFGFKKFK